MMEKIGVFVCNCEYHGASAVDLAHLEDELNQLPEVTFAKCYKDMCSDPGREVIKEAIKEKGLDGVLVSSCLPAVHGRAVQDTIASVGLHPNQLEMVNLTLDGRNFFDKEETVKEALNLIKAAITRLRLKQSLPMEKTPVIKKALVIGGGVSGIHAALDIASGGYEVFLVEKTPSIGGNMVKLSEVFPTLDCPQCILTPKMVQCGQHPNINILAYSEIEEVKGQVGDFEVLVKRKGTCIDWDKCTGCGECSKVCPVDMYSDFQRGTAPRKAAYKPFAQAVPNKLVIDKRGVSPCRDACPLHLNCHGYVQLIKVGKFKEALKIIKEKLPFPKVVGIICDHPCERVCKRTEVDKPIPICALKRFVADKEGELEIEEDVVIAEEKDKKVAVVGAGPAGLMAAYDLRKMGYQVTIFDEHEKPGGLLVYGFPSYRLPKEIVEQEIAIIEKLGARYRLKTKVGKDLTISEIHSDYNALFIAVGTTGCTSLFSEKEHLRLALTRKHTLQVDPLTLETGEDGIFAGGDSVTGPNTVIDAMAAGRKAAVSIDRYLRGEDLCLGREKEGPIKSDMELDLRKRLIDYSYLKVREGEAVPSRDEIEPDLEKELTPEEKKARQKAPYMIQPEEPILSEEEAIAEASRCLNCAGCCECMSCVPACEANAIDHNLGGDRYETIHVGAIVVASGYELLSKDLIEEYKRDPDVMDPLQFERILCPSGPTDGVVIRPSDGKVPKEVVFIECVGSRDPEHHLPYCSRVCCMYSCKMGMLYKHAVHDGTMYIFYMDVRTDGKMYEEFYQRGTEEDGLIYIRGRVSRVFRDGEKIMVWGSDTLTGKRVEVAADLVVLAMAIIPRPDAKHLAKVLGIETDEFGFMKVAHTRLRPFESEVPGIFLAGCCQSPKDIPECVAQSCGCAGKVLSLFSRDEVEYSLPVSDIVNL